MATLKVKFLEDLELTDGTKSYEFKASNWYKIPIWMAKELQKQAYCTFVEKVNLKGEINEKTRTRK